MHVVVVGAGVFGTWTAHHLVERGAEVTVVEAYGPGNSRSNSGDETRILRCGYGRDTRYSELAHGSLEQWHALDDRAGAGALWHACGVLWLAAGRDEYTNATQRSLEERGDRCEVLDAAELRRRFAEIDAGG